MDRPTKDEVLHQLRAFGIEVRRSCEKADADGVAREVVEIMDAAVWRATYLAERLLATTGRDYVSPDMANQMFALSRSLEAAVPSIGDPVLSAAIGSAAESLRSFVSRYQPKQTESGKFVFPLEGDAE